jgi:hypothetical protein
MRQAILKCTALVILGLIAILLLVQPVAAEETSPDSWQYSATIYAWMPAIKGETASGEDVDISFSDILKNLDFTFMGGVAARKNKFSLLTDVLYMDLEDTSNNTVVQGPPTSLSVTNVELKAWIVTPMVAYNVVQSDRVKLDLLAGARYLYLNATVDYKIQDSSGTQKNSESGSDGFWDGIVGAIGQIKINEKWYLPFQCDVGTGETDLTWQVFGGVGYKFKNLDLVAGYRHLEFDFDSSDKAGNLLNDLYITGPMVGVRYFF